MNAGPEVWRAGLPPGVYEARQVEERAPTLRPDVTAFVGLTARGPVGEATGCSSWAAFQAVFGPTGGGRQLPDAVRLFFANGGRRAVVVRVVGEQARATTWALAGFSRGGAPPRLTMRDPGAWGDRARISYLLLARPLAGPFASMDESGRLWRCPAAGAPALGELLRAQWIEPVNGASLASRQVFVEAVQRQGDAVELSLSAPLPANAIFRAALRLRLRVALDDIDEQFDELGLHPDSAQFIGAVLTARSRLLDGSSLVGILWPDVTLNAGQWVHLVGVPESSGSERGDALHRGHFLQPTTERSLDEILSHWDDLHETEPVSLLNFPDFFHSPAQLPGIDAPIVPPIDEDLRFRDECLPTVWAPTQAVAPAWPALSAPASSAQRLAEAQRLLGFTERGRRVLLLDLPPALDADALTQWRQALASPRVALYAPWLLGAVDGALCAFPPGGAVAGLIASVDQARGPGHTAARLIVRGALRLAPDTRLPDAGFLHQERVNALRETERGLELLGARTTSNDPEWTHICVRRLIDWICLQIPLDVRWAAFEPNDERLWRRLELCVERRLEGLLQAGVLAGPDPARSWFVRCDGSTNATLDIDNGRIVALIGVAPARPAEFVVFRLALLRDGSAGLEAANV